MIPEQERQSDPFYVAVLRAALRDGALRADDRVLVVCGGTKDEEARFPLRLAQSLSRALSEAGLRFHKSANKTTFVSVARPRHLNLEETAVSDSIKKIIELIRAKKSLRRHELLDQLAPLPKQAPAVPAEAAEPVAATAPASAAPEPAAPSETTSSPEVTAPIAVLPLKSPEEAARDAVVQDLLWLTHEGYVIEYADSRLESVPPPKNPPKPVAEAGEATISPQNGPPVAGASPAAAEEPKA